MVDTALRFNRILVQANCPGCALTVRHCHVGLPIPNSAYSVVGKRKI